MSQRRLTWSIFGGVSAAIVTLIACMVDSLHGEWIFLQYLFYPVTFLGALLAWFYEGDNSPHRLYYLGCILSFAINIPLGGIIGFLIANRRNRIA